LAAFTGAFAARAITGCKIMTLTDQRAMHVTVKDKQLA
jgi:hypothetical protein